MGLIAWMTVGLVTGWLASEITRRQGADFFDNILFGIIGAFAAGFLSANLFAISDLMTRINLITLGASFLGALVSILITQSFRGDRAAVSGKSRVTDTRRASMAGRGSDPLCLTEMSRDDDRRTISMR